MKTELNSKEYVSFARRFVKETVATMDIDELRSIVTNHIHEEIQNGENDFGQEGAFEEMQAWDQDIFDGYRFPGCGDFGSVGHWQFTVIGSCPGTFLNERIT